MIHKQFNGIHWLEFELLADCPLIHGCFMRHGGHSTGELSSLNLGHRVGDAPENVEANFKKIKEALSLQEIVCAKICHGDAVEEINTSHTPLSDGLMTRTENLAISISQADCQAAIFYDPINHAIANVHSGWRSSVLNIYENTVKKMKSSYGSRPENLLVCISPSLGPENAEFVNYKEEFPESFSEFEIKPLHFDFWEISERQLKSAGVLPHHIQTARIDTYSNEDFFSFRRSKTTGRQATICSLRTKLS